MSADDEKMWTPSKTGDNADDNPRVIVETVRALTRETRDGFASVNRTLAVFARIENKLDVIVDRQNHQDAQIAAIQQEQARTAARLDALESKPAVRRQKAK